MASRDKTWPEVAAAIEAANLGAVYQIGRSGNRLALFNSKGWLCAKVAKDALAEVQAAARRNAHK